MCLQKYIIFSEFCFIILRRFLKNYNPDKDENDLNTWFAQAFSSSSSL